MDKIKIYLDNQLFSYLYRYENNLSIESSVSEWISQLINHKDKCEFYFSYAHILDISADESDHCLKQLGVMEKYVNHNYLIDENNEVVKKIISPTKAYSNGKVDYKSHKQIEIPPNFREFYDKFPELKKAVIDKFGTDPVNFSDQQCIELVRDFMTDGSFYMKFINSAKNRINSLSSEDKIKLQESLENVPLTLENYSSLYRSLDATQPISEGNKIKPKNSMIDSYHGYYARYCDYFISNDHYALEKNRICYKKFNIATQIIKMKDYLLIF